MDPKKRIALISERLSPLQPLLLEIIDESHRHATHTGKGTGGHFKLIVKASTLNGKTRIEQHRIIYELLNDLIPNEIHALQIIIPSN